MTCVHPQYFTKCPWINLNQLKLDKNNLGMSSLHCGTDITPMKFLENLSQLEFLDLTENRISSFDVDFSGMYNLHRLNLASNVLPCLQLKVLEQLGRLNSMRMKASKPKIHLILNNTRFMCRCEYLDFYKWLTTTSVNLTWKKDDHCMFDDHSFQTFDNISLIVSKLNELCISIDHNFLVSISTPVNGI